MSRQKKLKPLRAADRADQRASQAVVKEIGGRRFFIGRERNRRSRKYRQKFFSPQPINLTAAVQEHSKTKQGENAQ